MWSVDSLTVALSAHVEVAADSLHDAQIVATELERQLALSGVDHATLALECHPCDTGHEPTDRPRPATTELTTPGTTTIPRGPGAGTLASMGRFSNTIALAKVSWRVLRKDRELLLIPIFSFLASIAVLALIWLPTLSAIDTSALAGESEGPGSRPAPRRHHHRHGTEHHQRVLQRCSRGRRP